MSAIQRLFTVGIGIPLMLMLMLAMLILPLPGWLLDLLFTFNIALAVMVVLVSVYIERPLDFAAFPTVILVATLLRLGLNIASTRLVLLEGHGGGDAAGQVIKAFGEFVVGGNYVVGLVVFVILVLINFVVITKGAGRIAEVSARFTLDALPGKQMAIDADLNAGLIDQMPGRDANLLADQGLIGLQRDRGLLPDFVHFASGLTSGFRQLRKILLAEFPATQGTVAVVVAFEPS